MKKYLKQYLKEEWYDHIKKSSSFKRYVAKQETWLSIQKMVDAVIKISKICSFNHLLKK